MTLPRYDSATGRFQIVELDDVTGELVSVLHLFPAAVDIEAGNNRACAEYDFWKIHGTLLDGSALNGGIDA